MTGKRLTIIIVRLCYRGKMAVVRFSRKGTIAAHYNDFFARTNIILKNFLLQRKKTLPEWNETRANNKNTLHNLCIFCNIPNLSFQKYKFGKSLEKKLTF